MKAVYSVRNGDNNEELRYSLRSLDNLPFIDGLIIIGHCPTWLNRDEIELIKVEQRGENKVITYNGLEKFVDLCGDLGDFIYFNDDFFVLNKMSELPALNRGPCDDVINTLQPGTYRQSAIKTRDLLLKFGEKDLLSYELHMPMLMNTKRLGEVLRYCDLLEHGFKLVQLRTVYGNFYREQSRTVKDCKNISLQECDDFYSSSDGSFASSGIKDLFNIKSRYEG